MGTKDRAGDSLGHDDVAPFGAEIVNLDEARQRRDLKRLLDRFSKLIDRVNRHIPDDFEPSA